MLKLRTKLLLLLIAIFGVGIGVLSGIADGAYSALCLLVLPVLVALEGASILADFNAASDVERVTAAKEKSAHRRRRRVVRHRSDWQTPATHGSRQWTS